MTSGITEHNLEIYDKYGELYSGPIDHRTRVNAMRTLHEIHAQLPEVMRLISDASATANKRAK